MLVVYYLSYCPHSKNALRTLDEHRIRHQAIKADDTKQETITKNGELTGGYALFPQIFWQQRFVGGNDKLQQILSDLEAQRVPEAPADWSKRAWLSFLTDLV
jgi:glutaredoxin